MKVSKKFLLDYIDISNIPYAELAEKMVFAGNEYEEISKISTATNLVVGEVITCIKHPESNKLSICTVNIGEDNHVQIVCGAPNVKAGIKVIVAKVGANLPGNINITKASLAGVESNGMICSLLELGIDPKFVSEEGKTGIHILDKEAPVGEDVITYLGYDDEVISFELTANRGDLLSMLGMAYEVGAIYGKDVVYPEIEVEELTEKIDDYLTVEVKSDNCILYSAKMVKNVTVKESPLFIQNRLMASGIRPINNVVDISNYVMLEYGTPLHFFDADKLGNKIVVREALEKEVIVTLDGNTHELTSDSLVIADKEKPVALAGVMGGESTEVSEATKNIVIECAVFSPISVRTSAKRFVRSESSSRFEKGIDPARVEKALKRAAYLLNKYADGEVVASEIVVSNQKIKEKVINISLNKINTILGMNLSKEEVLSVFTRLKFQASTSNDIFTVTVPTRRGDITIPEDLIEEVGRIIGYEKVIGILPRLNVKSGKYTEKGKLIKELREHIYSLGLDGVLTYSLVSEKESEMFLDKETKRITLKDPMSEDKKHMRRSLIPSHINVYNYHSARGMNDISIFEIGSSYFTLNNEYIEETKITGLLAGNYLKNNHQKIAVKSDFYLAKGMVENILTYLGISNRYSFDAKLTLPDFHPGRSAAVVVDRVVVGYIGQIHPKYSKKEVYVFELNLDTLMKIKVRNIKYKEISKYPTISKDLAFVLPKNMETKDVLDVIKKAAGRLLLDAFVFDVYTGEHLEEDKKSVTYSLVFQDSTKTLVDVEVNQIIERIIEKVTTNDKVTLR